VKKTTKIAAAVLLITGCGLFNSLALAEGDPERGEAIGYSCMGCHGIKGYRNAYPSYRVPKLGGQKAPYLVVALQGYRDGTRQHPTMQAQASSLSDQQIEDLAAYFATLGTETVATGGTKDASFEPAATCVACHGQNGISASPTWPTLAGQHEDYLVYSLKQYRSGKRQNALMYAQASALSDAQIAALAAYYAGLEGLETTVKE
jgi:cytochrome c553